MTHLSRSLVLGCSALALAACGPDELASPGTGGDVIINNPAPTPGPAPTPTPTPGPGTGVTPADGCPQIADPQGLTDVGTITGPTGTWRVCELPARFDASSTIPYVEGVLYSMGGRVDVGTDGGPTASANDTNVTLTIEPGVIVYGNGADFLMVNRGNQISAVGTAERPIIFTSRANVLGTNTETSSGQWGGVVLGGRAPVTDCIEPNAAPGTVDCERQVEGATQPAIFGGVAEDDNSGRLSYVQIRYSGFVLSGNNELQSLTTGGTGTGTQFDHIQSVNSSDDGVEFFGGFVNMKHLIVAGAEDDSIDTDTGVKANLQYVIAAQRPGAGDTIIEADSDNGLYDQTPRQNTQIANATFIFADNGDQAIRIRGGTDYALINTLVVDSSPAGAPCLRVDQAQTMQAADAAIDEVGPPVFQSVALDCDTAFRDGSDGGPAAAELQTLFDSSANNNANFTNTLTSGFINGSNEDAVVAFDPSTLSSFFDATDHIGAVQAGDTWYQGWTCDSAALTFGNNTGACTTLPVYN